MLVKLCCGTLSSIFIFKKKSTFTVIQVSIFSSWYVVLGNIVQYVYELE